jgi:ribosomal protein S18 acetylase RimI-like enzyme
VLEWFERSATGAERAVWAVAEDGAAVAALEARGYRPAERAPWMALLTRGLGRLPGPAVPRGYTARSVGGDDDVERRVAVHRAAFHPSRVTVESYRAVMRAWPYRPELDCVVEAPDGSFAAYTLAWLDEANGVGELEPVGTHPAHRRLGLARAANLLALHRLREAGATSAVVACRGDDAYPVPKRLYESVGFRQVGRVLSYRRPSRR